MTGDELRLVLAVFLAIWLPLVAILWAFGNNEPDEPDPPEPGARDGPDLPG